MKATKINNIQAVRAFAALSVVFYHTSFRLPGLGSFGAYGVEVFFVISGYIMARICETNPHHFFRRRLIRIAPPYWAMTLFLFVLAMALPKQMGATRASVPELIQSLLFIPYYKSNGVLRPLLFVGWSLNYEMFFYLVLTLALAVWKRHVLVLSSLLIALTVLVCLPFQEHHWAIADFYGATAMLEFICGIVVYEVCRRVSPAQARAARLGCVLAVVVAVAGLVSAQAHLLPHLTLGAYQALTTVLAVALVMGASLLSQGGWDTRLAWVVLLGDASYILYLIHPFLEFSLDRLVAARWPVLHVDRPAGCVLGIALSVLAATALHVWVERPAVQALNKRFGGGRASTEMRAPLAQPQQVAS